MTIFDAILWLESHETRKQFPMVQFSADSDMATIGWVSLTSTLVAEVVVAEMTATELGAAQPQGHKQVEKRINQALSRDDLRCIWLDRVEEAQVSAAGLSFQEFRKLYVPPRLLYRDIYSEGSVAEKVRESTLADLQASGGQFMLYSA